MDEPEEGMSRGRIILGFVLTLIAIPLVFVATCVPVGFFAIGTNPLIVFGVYAVFFVGFGVRMAIWTENPGVRWAIIATIAAVLIVAALNYADTINLLSLR